MRHHTVLSTNWYMYEKMDDVGVRMKKELTATVDGCPYDINLEIVLTELELAAMGYNPAFDAEEEIVYDLGLMAIKKEMDIQSLLWDHINKVKWTLEQHETNSWGVKEWDQHCPFLFDPTVVPPEVDEEAMQEERDTWV